MSDVNLGRRKFLRLIGGGAVAARAGFVGGVAGALGTTAASGLQAAGVGVWQHATDLIDGLEATDALKALTDSRASFRIVTGTANKQALLQGKPPQPSRYIGGASSALNSVFCSAHPNLFEPQKCDLIEPEQSTIDDDAFLLGGPLANEELASDLGYEVALVSARDAQGKSVDQYLPKVRSNFCLKYEQFHGEGQLGFFDGSVKTANRYDKGELVTRPQFAIRDVDTGQIMRCEMSGDMLAQEFLQIVRLRRPNGSVRIYMWGLHGHSLEGFTSYHAFRDNLNELVDRVEGMDQFQALIPMALSVRNAPPDGHSMVATADWGSARIVDLDKRFRR